MFCKNCGAQTDEGTKFCKNCGAALGTQEQSQPPQQGNFEPQQTYAQPQYGQSPPPAQQPAKKNKGCLIAVIIVAALVLIFIVAAIINGGEISFTTANVSEAYMTSSIDPYTSEPLEISDVFYQYETMEVYAAALIKNVPGDTKISAMWYHIPTGSSIASENDIYTDQDTWVNFSLSMPDGFAYGEYKIEIYIDDELEETLYFTVK